MDNYLKSTGALQSHTYILYIYNSFTIINDSRAFNSLLDRSMTMPEAFKSPTWRKQDALTHRHLS